MLLLLQTLTSFDCYIAYKDNSDAFCGIGIEVKYTEMAYKLQPGSSEYRHTREKLSEEYLCVTLQSGCYHTLSAATDEEAFPKVLIEDDYRQLWRNHMLGMSMVQHSDIRHFLSVHLYISCRCICILPGTNTMRRCFLNTSVC